MADLFGAYTVRQVWDSGRLNDVCGYRAFITAIRNQPGAQYHNTVQDLGTSDYAFVGKLCDGVQLQAATVTLTLSSVIVTGSPITLGQNASMTILHANGDSQVPPNANSLVVRMDLGQTRVLFMGDAEAGGRKLPSNLPSKTSIEGKLLDCCTSDLAANVLIVGHHGSMTSSRKALLDAVSPTVSVVSSGPKKYGTVILPDMEIITELEGSGQVFRTDMDDAACATNPKKVGPDNDGKPGGCDNGRITIQGTMIQPEYFRGSEP
jgi:competence protein ComEC